MFLTDERLTRTPSSWPPRICALTDHPGRTEDLAEELRLAPARTHSGKPNSSESPFGSPGKKGAPHKTLGLGEEPHGPVHRRAGRRRGLPASQPFDAL